MYTFEAHFPDCSMLEISVWDYDSIFGDDLIGTTKIDLEDRYFHPDWNALVNKPVETRSLYIPSSELTQGLVRLWVEIVPTSVNPTKIKTYDISPKPSDNLEVRICVLNCKDVKTGDVEGTTDAYVRGFFDSNGQVFETDTHWRCQDGKPDFQYRLIYDFKHPNSNYKFTLQLYDRDVFSTNDLLGSAQVDLK